MHELYNTHPNVYAGVDWIVVSGNGFCHIVLPSRAEVATEEQMDICT